MVRRSLDEWRTNRSRFERSGHVRGEFLHRPCWQMRW